MFEFADEFYRQSWRIRLNALPTLIVFFYRNLMGTSNELATRVLDVLLDCLADENVEVREMASKMLSGVVRCSQRQSIIPLKVWTLPDCEIGVQLLSFSAGPLRQTRSRVETALSQGPKVFGIS